MSKEVSITSALDVDETFFKSMIEPVPDRDQIEVYPKDERFRPFFDSGQCQM